MNWLQKLLKAIGVDVTEEQAELIETAIDNKGKKEEVEKPKVEDKPKEKKVDSSDNETVKALEAKLAALEATIEAQKKEKSLDSLLSDTKDKDIVKMLLKDSENPEETLKGLKTSKPYLFNELPDIKGDNNQNLMDEFEREYRKEYLS